MPKYIECEPLVKDVWSSMEDNPHDNGALSLNHEHEHMHFLNMIARQPAANVVTVVRCRDCVSYGMDTNNGHPLSYDCSTNGPDDFCSHGEWKANMDGGADNKTD